MQRVGMLFLAAVCACGLAIVILVAIGVFRLSLPARMKPVILGPVAVEMGLGPEDCECDRAVLEFGVKDGEYDTALEVALDTARSVRLFEQACEAAGPDGAKILEKVGRDTMERLYAEACVEVYTLTELKGVRDLYRTELGKALLRGLPELMTKFQERLNPLVEAAAAAGE
jgi:hypothetical protein